jgi:hypothetical protein
METKMPRGVYERKPRQPKVTKEVTKTVKVKKDKVTKPEKVKKVKEPRIKKEKLPKIKPEMVTIEPAKRGWLQPLPLPKEIEIVSIDDIDPELRAEVSVFHEDGVAQFARMMYKNYGIKKFTSATFKNSKYYFFYEEPMLAGRFNRKK